MFSYNYIPNIISEEISAVLKRLPFEKTGTAKVCTRIGSEKSLHTFYDLDVDERWKVLREVCEKDMWKDAWINQSLCSMHDALWDEIALTKEKGKKTWLNYYADVKIRFAFSPS